MKRIFYSIGLVFAIFFLSCGFFLSYQLTSLRDRMNRLEQESALMGKQVSANPFSRDSDYVFESFNSDTGKLVKERYRVSSYADNQVVLRQELGDMSASDQETRYCVRMENGSLVVDLEDGKEVFEYTDIPLEALPSEEQAEVLGGKEIVGTDELYSFLENYSS